MAYYVSAHADRARRTAGTLPTVTGDFSVGGWFYTAGTGSGYGYALSILGNTGEGFYLDFGSNSWAMLIEDENGVSWYGASLGTLTANTWYHVAMTKTSSSLTGHRRALGTTTYTSGTTPSAPDSIATVTSITIGGDERYGDTNNYRQSRLFGWKFWQGIALTTAQLLEESYKVLPVYRSNVWAVYPLINNSGKDIASGYALTVDGTSTQDSPPVSWGGSPITYSLLAGGTEYQQSVSGNLSFSGSVYKKSFKILAGGLTPTGTLDAVRVPTITAQQVGSIIRLTWEE